MFIKKLASFIALCVLFLPPLVQASDLDSFDPGKQQIPHSGATYASATPITDSEDSMSFDTFSHILPHLKIVDVIQATYIC